MRWFNPIRPALAAALLALLAAGLHAQPEPAEDPAGVEVLTRGPVHEAYANLADARPEASPIVEKEPPEVVDEMPPEERPEGDDVRWIPGYWHWDDEEDEFLWVSGFWRDVPPDYRWMPGGWHRVKSGWQWVPGFWAGDKDDEVEYVPPPPESLDRGPSTPAPDEASIYTPGCWVFHEARFHWRPGFWVRARPDWVYVPACYTWTPVGCVFVEGHWDHPLHDRGLLFAPIRIDRTVVVRQWAYTPRYVVRADALLGALFVRSQTRHYHFGDYFDTRYAKRFVSWVDYHPARNQADVNFSYYRRQFGSERWEKNVREFYAARVRGDIAPPPRTLVQQHQVMNQLTVNKTQNIAVNKTFNITNIQNASVVAPITKLNNTNVTALAALGRPGATDGRPVEPPRTDVKRVLKLESVSKDQRKVVVEAATRTREAAAARRKEEARLFSEAAKRGERDAPPKAIRAPLPRPPAAAPPPPRPDTPTQPRKERPPAPKPPKPEAKPAPPAPPQPPPQRKDERPDRPKQPPKDTKPPEPKPPPPKPPAPKPPDPKPPAPKPPAPKPPRDEKPKPPAPTPPAPKPPDPKPPAPKPPAPKPDDKPKPPRDKKPPAPKPPAPQPPRDEKPKPPAPTPPAATPPTPKPPPQKPDKPDRSKDTKPPKPKDESSLRD